MTPTFLIVDLFCGAGGTTTGFAKAQIDGQNIAKIIACVNHDPTAIDSHWKNHPDVVHFEEDIRTLNLTALTALAKHWQRQYPDAYLVLWASLECTNFSKAKGGQPRNADSRTLAEHLDRYVEALNPDYIQIENVVEFMSWGPLDDNGKPLSRKNGSDFLRWKNSICQYGYRDEWREINSANLGAYTSRNRLFGIFAKPHLPIAWPTATHAKNPSKNGMYGDLKKWKAVKEVLDFTDQGESIFNRKKALSDKTLERIYAGLVKFIGKGDTAFLSNYFSGRPADKNKSVENPAGTLTTVDHHSLVQGEFLVKYNSLGKNGNYNPPGIDEPSPVVSTQNRLYLAQCEFITQRNSGKPESKLVSVDGPARTLTGTGGNQDLLQPQFLAAYYGNGDNISSVDSPAPTIPTKDRCALVQPQFFIDKQFTTGNSNHQSIEAPLGSVMPVDKHRLVEVKGMLINPGWGGNPGDIDQPCCVIVARQDKAPLSFVQVEHGPVAVCIYEADSEIMVKIKQFMAVYSLVDIKMRMLRVTELLKIQGFPSSYHLAGNQSDQKKFIGNSVVPHVVKAWCEAMAQNILFNNKRKTA
jgi:DNA (cytosine-5)-methyltransferase 1